MIKNDFLSITENKQPYNFHFMREEKSSYMLNVGSDETTNTTWITSPFNYSRKVRFVEEPYFSKENEMKNETETKTMAERYPCNCSTNSEIVGIDGLNTFADDFKTGMIDTLESTIIIGHLSDSNFMVQSLKERLEECTSKFTENGVQLGSSPCNMADLCPACSAHSHGNHEFVAKEGERVLKFTMEWNESIPEEEKKLISKVVAFLKTSFNLNQEKGSLSYVHHQHNRLLEFNDNGEYELKNYEHFAMSAVFDEANNDENQLLQVYLDEFFKKLNYFIYKAQSSMPDYEIIWISPITSQQLPLHWMFGEKFMNMIKNPELIPKAIFTNQNIIGLKLSA